MSEAKPTPGPCPFCGHVGIDFAEGSTFRWIVASCGGCGASLDETRIQTLGEGTKDEWMAEAKADAIAAWNRRSDPLVERVKELEEALVEARSVLSSVCTNKHRRVVEDGVVLYTQTEEWCRWAEGEVLVKVVAALSRARPNTAEGE